MSVHRTLKNFAETCRTRGFRCEIHDRPEWRAYSLYLVRPEQRFAQNIPYEDFPTEEVPRLLDDLFREATGTSVWEQLPDNLEIRDNLRLLCQSVDRVDKAVRETQGELAKKLEAAEQQLKEREEQLQEWMDKTKEPEAEPVKARHRWTEAKMAMDVFVVLILLFVLSLAVIF